MDTQAACVMSNGKPLVVPGMMLTGDAKKFLHGKGTYQVTAAGGEQLYASMVGELTKLSQMVSVEPPTGRYTGNTGDCVVGTITSIAQGKWKVDLNSHLEASLLLSNVNLPGGHLRRKTAEDQRQMRSLYQENDVVSAEVQKVNRDGSVSLHTRSTRYGKLRNGVLVTVPACLIKRLKTHFHDFDFGISALIGVNGRIWLHKTKKAVKQKERGDDDSEDEEDEKKNPLKQASQNPMEEDPDAAVLPCSAEDRKNIARVRGCILLLAKEHLEISPNTIIDVFNASVTLHIPPQDIACSQDKALVQDAIEHIKGVKKRKSGVKRARKEE
eukprot:Sspe_Gene.89596::Locus_61341_Transcript_1_1_Confidence_1.000_Length_1075::g.89596::m.89596/K03679/RRP4, EXOSC2; exosome complex component RRP4